jgi:hypothetical protein
MPVVTITMSASTVQELTQAGYSLAVFKAVRTTAIGAVPVLWTRTNQILETMQVSWPDQYGAYISNSEIMPNGMIEAASQVAASLGETVSVAGSGNLSVAGQGQPGAISILNEAWPQWTAGICEMANGQFAPTMAIPLYGEVLGEITPVEKVLLMFSTMPVNPGTVIFQAFSSGVLVDLTADSDRQVYFDFNAGWSWSGGEPWVRSVFPESNLVPLLVE